MFMKLHAVSALRYKAHQDYCFMKIANSFSLSSKRIRLKTVVPLYICSTD